MNPTLALIILTAIQVATSFAATAVLAISPLLVNSLQISPKWIGLYTALLFAAAAWSSIYFGNRVHRMGSFQVSRICLGMCSLGMLLIGSLHGAAILLGSILMGVGYGGIMPASSYYLSQTTALKHRSLLFSIRQSGVPAGAALAAVTVPVMTQQLGILPAFALPGMLGLIAAACFRARSVTHDNAAAGPGALEQSGLWTALLENPKLRTLALIAFIFSGLQVTVTAMLVPFLNSFANMTIDQAAGFLTLFNVVGIAFRLVWGRCVDRGWSALQMLGFSALLGIAGFAIMAWAAFAVIPWTMLLVAAVALGVAVIAWNGVLFSEIVAIVPAHKVGQATGLCVFAGFVGVVLMPTILTQSLENKHASGLVFTIGAVLSAFTFVLTKNRRRAEVSGA
jgi:MFS family permease